MADGGEHALNRIGRAQVVPMFGRAVKERQQGLGVLGQAGDGRGVFDPLFFREDRYGSQGCSFRFGVMNVLQV